LEPRLVYLPMEVKRCLVEEGVILPHKLSAHGLRTGSVHYHSGFTLIFQNLLFKSTST
jgi:hypothetical protein